MPLSLPRILLLAKQLEIEELKRLQSRARLVGVLSHLVHAVQAERGASSIYLASAGQRFEETRQKLAGESESVERVLREVLAEELRHSSFSSPKILSLIAWVLAGLDAMPELRGRVDHRLLPGNAAVAAFSRLIAGLTSLILEVADAAVDPEVSRLLVSLFNLVEGKEHAGQERAVGSLAFAAGACEPPLQVRMRHLIDAQARNFRIFLDFADDALKSRWQAMENQAFMPQLTRLRGLLEDAGPDTRLDASLSDAWFDCCSERMTYMWSVQRHLVESLQRRCESLIAQAERALTDSEGLLKSVHETSPTRVDAVERFFDPNVPVEQALSFQADENASSDPARSVLDLLQAQSRHLAAMENELAAARTALNERKIIERAKGMAMVRYRLSEEEAYSRMRKMAMDKNLRLVQVAELLLA